MTKLMDTRRKEGLVDIKKKVNEIIMNDSLSMIIKLQRLYDEDLKNYMNEVLNVQ